MLCFVLSLPLIGEFNSTTADRYRKADKPILKVYLQVDWGVNFRHMQYYINRLRDVANKNKDALLVVVADVDKNANEMEALNRESFIHSLHFIYFC